MRSPREFKKNMKLEVVDKRNPALIRVATIVEVQDYMIKIHFDGWGEEYDYWIDDDSLDIHPPSWCGKTGHLLQPPLTPEQQAEDVDSGVGCGTPGCKGCGHFKGPIYTTHHTAYGCPYSLQNLNKDPEIPDRLEPPPQEKKKGKPQKPKLDLTDYSKESVGLEEDSDVAKKRVRKRRKFFDELQPPEPQKPHKVGKLNTSSSGEDLLCGPYSPSNGDLTAIAVPHSIPPLASLAMTETATTITQHHEGVSSSLDNSNASSSTSVTVSIAQGHLAAQQQHQQPVFVQQSSGASTSSCIQAVPPQQPIQYARPEYGLDSLVHQSVFNPGYAPNPVPPQPHSWEQHKHLMTPLGPGPSRTQVCSWSPAQVGELVQKIPGCSGIGAAFVAQQVDGEALLMMTQNDLITMLNIKLEPAIKIMAIIMCLKASK